MELLTAWHDWEFNSQPYLLGGDDLLLSKPRSRAQVAIHSSWESFIGEEDFGVPGDTRFHLGLVPVPFAGDIERAKVIVLLLNPGLEPDDYFGEIQGRWISRPNDLQFAARFQPDRLPFRVLRSYYLLALGVPLVAWEVSTSHCCAD